MESDSKIINSLYLQDELNPDIWYLPNEKHMGDPEAQFYKLKPEIKERLLKVSEIFLDYIDIDIYVHDIILIGSLTGYNWSDFSDFDVHILYDFNDAGENADLYRELFHLKKTVFNAKHDIKIKGYEVEMFIQDLNEKETSAGSYSVLYNKWLRSPEKENFKIDKKIIKEKANQWMRIIDGVLENAEEEDLNDAIKLDISKLEDFKNKITDKKLSLEQEIGE